MKQNNSSQIIYINSIMKNPSLCDGTGYRTVLSCRAVICIVRVATIKKLGILPKGFGLQLQNLRTHCGKVALIKNLLFPAESL